MKWTFSASQPVQAQTILCVDESFSLDALRSDSVSQSGIENNSPSEVVQPFSVGDRIFASA
jgi:hypothetical protein